MLKNRWLETPEGIVIHPSNSVRQVLVCPQGFARLTAGTLSLTNSGYPRIKGTLLHRLFLQPPEGFIVHHINGNPLDNRLSNLEVITQSENTRLRKRSLNLPGYRCEFVLGGEVVVKHFHTEAEARLTIESIRNLLCH